MATVVGIICGRGLSIHMCVENNKLALYKLLLYYDMQSFITAVVKEQDGACFSFEGGHD